MSASPLSVLLFNRQLLLFIASISSSPLTPCLPPATSTVSASPPNNPNLPPETRSLNPNIIQNSNLISYLYTLIKLASLRRPGGVWCTPASLGVERDYVINIAREGPVRLGGRPWTTLLVFPPFFLTVSFSALDFWRPFGFNYYFAVFDSKLRLSTFTTSINAQLL
ncbi:hypothetical protein C8R43DRAFT_999576 [Mycena crocata]|nr:hypothetical protein C8R43DRAFT_999576 [Mycena crocata]